VSKISKADIIRQVITKTGLTKKKEIARYLVEHYPNEFTDLEKARTLVRAVTGAAGEEKRAEFKNPEKFKFFTNGFETWASENLNVEGRPWDTPFEIPSSIKVLNVIADLHSIHMDYRVMEKFLKDVKDKTAVLINGDLLDSESLSRHIKQHNLIGYEKELEICHNILKGLKEEFDHVYFKAGNHDFWLERYLLINAREIFRLRGLQIEELLQCGALGVHFIHNLRYIKYGDLDIIHGHEFSSGFGAGKFPAAGYVDKWQTFKKAYDVKILASHCHRQDIVMSRRSKDGQYGIGWVTPAFCRKSAQYNPYAGWDNGWTELVNKDGKVEVTIHIINI